VFFCDNQIRESKIHGIGTAMGREKEVRRRRHDPVEMEGIDRSSRRTRVDPDERDEYEEWRRERGKRGRKRKGKAGGRHRRHRDDDEY
jgi:hypothetical protein